MDAAVPTCCDRISKGGADNMCTYVHMKINLSFLLCALFLTVFQTALAADLDYKFYPLGSDLPSLSVSAFAQDPRGYVWIGTSHSGVIKYVPGSWKAFISVPFDESSLASSQVQCMYMDGECLWVGTHAGLSAIDTVSGSVHNFTLTDSVVCSIFKDSHGRLWVGTLNGLFLFFDKDGSFVRYAPDNQKHYLENETVRSIYEDVSGTLYACTYGGVFYYNEHSDAFYRPDFAVKENPIFDGKVYAAFEDENGFFWTAVWDKGLIKTDPATKDFTVYSLPDNRIYTVNHTFEKGVVLAGTFGGGLYRFDTKTKKTVSYTTKSFASHRLSHDTVLALFEDVVGLLWVGTQGGGINMYDRRRLQFLNSSESNKALPGKSIRCLEQDGDFLWIGLQNDGLILYDTFNCSRSFFNKKNGRLIGNTVNSIHIGADGTCYAGTDEGLAVYNAAKERFEPVKQFAEAFPDVLVYSLGTDLSGNVWVGTYGKGLMCCNLQTGEIRHFLYSEFEDCYLSDNIIYDIKCDAQNRVWIATNRGLNLFNRQTGEFKKYLYDPKNTKGIPGNGILNLFVHDDGRLWIGTKGNGFSIFNPETGIFENYGFENGLNLNTVFGFEQMSNGDFFVAANSGLYIFSADLKTFSIYHVSNDVFTERFNGHPLRFNKTVVYFPTTQGLVYFDEDMYSKFRSEVFVKPKMAITDFSLNGLSPDGGFSAESSQRLQLKNNIPVVEAFRATFNAQYALLDYSPLARPNYAYKLEGFDSDWVPAGNRNFVQYTNLRPGTYRFTVKAVKTGDDKTSESAETVFVIKQLLFLRWYFLLLYLVITAAFVFMVLKLRTLAHTRKRLDELEHIQRTLQKENKKLESLTYKDSLTGVYNRHGLTAYLKKIWPLLVKDKDSLAVLMVDIDYFKTYNDTHGHLAGDKILKIIASTLKDVTKKEGNVFRYGGDEFVVLLARHECGSANFFAERIRENVENKTSELFDGSLTVSIGVFVWRVTNCNSYEDFIAKADTALYCAKQNGRNRVCCL